MKLSHFFIDLPIFACVLSILLTLVGGFAYFTLPVAQYPEVAPPTIVVTASYPGASAETVANSVAARKRNEENRRRENIHDPHELRARNGVDRDAATGSL